MSTPVAGLSIIKLRKQKAHVSAGIAGAGFYAVEYTSGATRSHINTDVSTAGVFLLRRSCNSSWLPAVVLVLEEIHAREEQVREQNAALRLKKVMWRSHAPAIRVNPAPRLGAPDFQFFF